MPAIKTIISRLLQPCLKKVRHTRFFITMLLMSCHIVVLAGVQPSREYQLKAVFLFNFTQFIEWPPSAFESGESPFVIGILGKNPFGTYLEQTISGEKVNGHPVIIQYYTNIEEIKICHILFCNAAEQKKQEQAIAGLKDRGILTVSDAPHFPEYGGMIRFFTRDNKIKLQVNLKAAKNAGLNLSSKLLRLAEIYDPKEK